MLNCALRSPELRLDDELDVVDVELPPGGPHAPAPVDADDAEPVDVDDDESAAEGPPAPPAPAALTGPTSHAGPLLRWIRRTSSCEYGAEEHAHIFQKYFYIVSYKTIRNYTL